MTYNAVISVQTEMTEESRSLSPAAQKFILHWGEMGTRWGINRTVAQVHALLFLSSQPMAAEEIARTLSVARSNVSTSLRELQGWRIVRSVSVFGDRRQHFESMKDLHEMFRVILEERKRRGIALPWEYTFLCGVWCLAGDAWAMWSIRGKKDGSRSRCRG